MDEDAAETPTIRYDGESLPVDDGFARIASDLGAVYDGDDGETHTFTVEAPPGVGRRDVRRGVAAAADAQWTRESEEHLTQTGRYLAVGLGFTGLDHLADLPAVPEEFLGHVFLFAAGFGAISTASERWDEHRSDRADEIAQEIDVHTERHEKPGWSTYVVEYEEPIRYDLFEPTKQKLTDLYEGVRDATVGRPMEYDVDVMQVKRGDRLSAEGGEGMLFSSVGEYSRDEKEARIEHALNAIADWADDHGYELDVKREMDRKTRPKYVERAEITAGEVTDTPVVEGEVAYEFRSEYPQHRPSVVHARLDFADRHADAQEQAALEQYVEAAMQAPVGTDV